MGAFDNPIERQSPNEPTRIAAVIASDRRFGTRAFAIRLLRRRQAPVGRPPFPVEGRPDL
jgi:hypothetical protein